MGNVFNMVGGGAGKLEELAQYKAPITLSINPVTQVATATGLINALTTDATYTFILDGVQKAQNTTGIWDYSSEGLVVDSIHEIVCRIDCADTYFGEPIILTQILKITPPTITATVTGLGSYTPSTDVTFDVSSEFDFNFEEVEKLNPITGVNDVFIKIPKFYRKVVSVSSYQITSYIISPTKVDNDYYPYPCFVKEDGVTEMDYILVGKYLTSSSSVMNSINATPVTQTISGSRTNAQALGNGYQLYDWQMQRLFQDLVCCYLQKIDTNSGSNYIVSLLGIRDIYYNTFVDGISKVGSNWIFSYKPSAYVNEPTSSTTDYYQAIYTGPSASSSSRNTISKLGYDSSHVFFNYPSSTSGTTYQNCYYCDACEYINGTRLLKTNVGLNSSYYGVFYCDTTYAFTGTGYARLCYRPIDE